MAKLKVVDRYGVIPTAILRDKRLSLKAKGLFAYMQSKPDGWEFSAKRMATESNDGERAILAGLKELEEVGYLLRKKNKDITGKWCWEHILQYPAHSSPSSGFAGTENSVIKKDIESKKDKYIVEPEVSTGDEKSFSVKDWVTSLSQSKQPHVRLIGYYFNKAGHNFPNKKVATEEFNKNLKPAVWLISNFSKEEIKKTILHCEEKFSEVHWNLSTVKKQIAYVTSKI